MKKKNNISKSLFLILIVLVNVFIFNVNAYAFDVKISDIKIVEQSTSVNVSDPTIDEDNNISSNIIFNKVNEFVTYEIELKNNDNVRYVIEKVKNNNTNNNITVTAEFDKRYIEKQSTNKIRIKIKYKNELQNVKEFSIKDLEIKINLTDDDGKKQTIIINNPKTGDGIVKYLIFLIVSITVLMFMKKKKKNKMILLLLLVIILPFTIFANQKFERVLKFDNIKINGVMLPYKVTFNYDNGLDSENITKHYDDKLGTLPTPEKEGYDFIGWFNGEEEVTEDTIVTEDITLTAKYAIILYSIDYDLNGGELEKDNPNIYTINDEITLNNPKKEGYTFIGWTGSNGSIPSTNILIEKGSIGTKEYIANYIPNMDTKYKVIHKQMNLDGNTFTIKEEENLEGTTDEEVTPPVKDYVGFKSPREQTIVISSDGNTVLEYLYERKKYSLTIEDRDYIDEGNSTRNGEYFYGTEIKAKTLPRTGYTFVGWSNGETKAEISFKLEENITIRPLYSSNKNTKYTVIHKLMNIDGEGYTEEDTEIFTGETNTKVTPKVKTYEGFISPSAKEITILSDGTAEVEYLYERKKYTFNVEDRSNIEDDSTANGEYYYGSVITLKAKEIPGYTFTGWSNNTLSSEYTFNLSQNTIIGATYSANKNTKYTVIHRQMSLDGAEFVEKEVEELFGETDKEVIPAVKIYKGFTSPVAKSLTITGDGNATITYDYIRNFYEFNISDRTYIDEVNSNNNGEYYYGSKITVIAYERDGYNFKWSDGDTSYEKTFNIEKNVTLTPIYTTKGDTPYKVIHKLMNLDGSTYSIKDTDNYTGFTDEEVTPAVNIYEGFVSPSVKTITITGDGKAEVEYLYERKKYKFTLEDSTYIDQQKSTPSGEYYYGSEIKEIALERNGYTFTGWNNGEKDIEITFALEENISLMPMYEPNTNTPYKVIHKQMSLDGTLYLVKEEETFEGETDTEVTPPVKTYEGFTSPSTQTVNIDGDGTREVEYLYTRNKYTFNIGDRSYIDENSTSNGEYYYETKIKITALDKPGYTFVGWSNGETDTTYEFNLLKNTDISPVYSTKNDTPYEVIHKLMNVDGNGYTEEDTEIFTGETDTVVTPPVKTYEGFTSPEAKEVKIKGDGKTKVEYLYERNKYTFNVENRNNIDEDNSFSNGEYYYDTEVTVIAKIIPGYTFTGWNDGVLSNIYTFNIKNDKTINPTYTPNDYTVIFDSNGSIGEMQDQVFTYDTEEKIKANEFTMEGYHFSSWNTNANGSGKSYGNEELVKNITTNETVFLYAQFEPNTDTPYKVIHKRQDLVGNYTIIEEDTLTGTTDSEVTPPVKTYNGFTSPIASLLTINADGSSEIEYYYDRNSYTVTFDSNGGSEVLPVERYYEEQIGDLPIVTKDSAVFIGWYTNLNGGEEVTSIDQVKNDTTIYARWSEASATFLNGRELNVKMKSLVNSEENEITYLTPNYDIISIEYFDEMPDIDSMTSDNVVSTNDSVAPIYMWYNNGTIYWWSEDKKPSFNEDSSYLFSNMNAFTTIDFSNYNTSNVRNMSYMFNNSVSLESIDLSSFNTSNVTNMSNMFNGCTNLKNVDFTNIKTNKVTDMSNMFTGCLSLTNIDLSEFTTNNVANMSGMFSGCSSLSGLNLNSFNTNNVTNMSNMFSGCLSLTSLDLSNFNTSNVTDLSNFVYFDTNLTSINLSSFDTSNVTNMSGMFSYCSSFINLNLSNFHTNNVTNMSNMFNGFNSLSNLDISNFDTSNVTNMNNMFSNTNITELDLSNVNTSNVLNMDNMFSNSSNLITIYVKDKFVLNENVSSKDMFINTYHLAGGSGTTYDLSKIDKEYAKVDEGPSNKGYFSNHYYIEFNSNTGEGSMTNQGVPLDKNALIKTNEFIKDGYAFKGWNTKADGTGTSYQNNALINNISTIRNDVVTLYAQWVDATSNFLTGKEINEKMKKLANLNEEITYLSSDNNIISIEHSSEQPNLSLMTEDNIISTSNSNVPIYIWYDQGVINWWSQDNYPKLNADSSYLFSNLQNLTNVDIVMFNFDEVTDISYMFMNDTSLETLELSELDTTNITNMESTFDGCTNLKTIYVTDKFVTTNVTNSQNMFNNCTSLVGGSGTAYDSSNIDKEYAKVDDGSSNKGYFTNHYYIEFNSNGGEGTMPNQGIVIGKSANLKENTFTKSNYSFKEWNTKADGSGTKYQNKESINLELQRDESITLYAIWEIDKFTVTFDSNGGSAVHSKIINYGSAIGNLPTTDRNNYKFTGWYTAKAGGEKIDSSVVITEDVTYYAMWDMICPDNNKNTFANGIVCKRASTLHTEVCDQSSYFCSNNEGTGNEIVYGKCGVSNTLSTGDAFDCDVNGDGNYNERFYYVSDYYNTKTQSFDSSYATLIYYKDTSDGNIAYGETKESWLGPNVAINYLPTTTLWSNISLKDSNRQLLGYHSYTNKVTTNLPMYSSTHTLGTFNYTDRAARLLTYMELKQGCLTDSSSTSSLVNCSFILENTRYSNKKKRTYEVLMENPDAARTDSDCVWIVDAMLPSVNSVFTTYSGGYGARPVIEVPKSKIDLGTSSSSTSNSSSLSNILDKINTSGMSKIILLILIPILLLLLIIYIVRRKKSKKD